MTTTGTLSQFFLPVLFLQLIGNLNGDWRHQLPDDTNVRSWQYCVIGAGPAGLQMGYFLHRARRDYVIIERASASGSFFLKYPRHRKLISINKRHTGKTNKEFNLRHDWNSLLSDDDSLQMKYYSKDFFPHADTYVQYLNDYANRLDLNVKYNTEVRNISRLKTGTFVLSDQTANQYTCSILIMSTGIAKPTDLPFQGREHTEDYGNISLDQDDFEGKSVLIIGRGNSAFETADHILGSTNVIHMVSRSRIKMAWETHYVGDLRAVNNGLLDTYQLKSLDGVLEGDISEMAILKRPRDGRFLLVDSFEVEEAIKHNLTTAGGSFESRVARMMPDNFALRDPYDKVIRCLGFVFDGGVFSNDTRPEMESSRKFPKMFPNYESVGVPGLFFAGAISHAIDHKKSAGGFIHGYRYTTRSLFRMLEVRYQSENWPSVRLPVTELVNHIIKRINEASGTYQMFGVLVDVIILHNDGTEFEYLEEFPVKLLANLPQVTRRQAECVIVIVMEYGKDFSAEDMSTLGPKDILPAPNRLHHVIEDFLTDWTAPVSHILLLRRFLESCLNRDLRHFFDTTCFHLAMTHASLPLSCRQHYANGQGLPARDVYWDHVADMHSLLGNVGIAENSATRVSSNLASSHQRAAGGGR